MSASKRRAEYDGAAEGVARVREEAAVEVMRNGYADY
jgi:hypothetical protein